MNGVLNVGELFSLTLDVLAVEHVAGKSQVVILPLGSTVRLANLSCAYDGRMVEISWGDRTLMLFSKDLKWHASKVQFPGGLSGQGWYAPDFTPSIYAS